MALGERLGPGRPLLVCVLQGEGCCLAARRFSPALGLPATLKKGIGKQLALPGHLPRGERVGGRETGQGRGPWVAVGSITWRKKGAGLSRGAEGLQRRLLQETQWERLTAAGNEFVPPGSGDPAELQSSLQHLALPEKSLPYVHVCLAYQLKPNFCPAVSFGGAFGLV